MRFFFNSSRCRSAFSLSRPALNVVKFQEEERSMLKLSLAHVLILIRANQMNTRHIKITPDDNHLTFMSAVIPVRVPFPHITVDTIDVKATREEREERDVDIHIFDYPLHFLYHVSARAGYKEKKSLQLNNIFLSDSGELCIAILQHVQVFKWNFISGEYIGEN